MEANVVGEIFAGRYEIRWSLGRGGMAEVYLARDLRLDRDVALKVLLPHFADDPEFIERFRREAGAAARLNHPNIVHIYDWGEAEGTYYISMEHVPGRSLKETILASAPLEPDQVVAYGRQVLAALGYAHARGIVHRDVKPQNIMIDDEGRAKVTDFGIARAMGALEMTDKGTVLGTAQYLSPEQAQGEMVSPASDLYSAGVVLYEMATGRQPFVGDNPVTIGMQHVHQPPPLPRSLTPDLSPRLESIILQALAKDPEDRYQSAQEFLADLDRYAQGRAVLAGTPGVGERTTVRPVAAAAPLPVTEVRPAVEHRPPLQPAPSPVRSRGLGSGPMPPPPPPPSRRLRPILVWTFVALLVLVLAGAGYAAARGVFDGAQTISTPDLRGRTLADARSLAADEGLSIEQSGPPVVSEEFEEGTIARQRPEAGASARTGGTVQVWLSAGPAPVAVPDLVGMNREEAIRTLMGWDLVPSIQERERADTRPGYVFAQDPAPRREVARGSTVEVFVAVSPAPTTTTEPPTTTTSAPPTTLPPGPPDDDDNDQPGGGPPSGDGPPANPPGQDGIPPGLQDRGSIFDSLSDDIREWFEGFRQKFADLW